MPGVFAAKLTISDIATGTVVAEPTMRFRAGESAETRAGEDEKGVAFQFSVSVNQEGSQASYKAEAIQKGAVISRSQAKITLNK